MMDQIRQFLSQLESLQIHVPDLPPWAFAGTAVGGLVVGALLLLWGRKLSRILMAAWGAGVGWGAGYLLLPYIPAPPLAIHAASAVVLALIFAALASLLWALLAGLLLAVVSGAFLAGFVVWQWLQRMQEALQAQTPTDDPAAANRTAERLAELSREVWQANGPLLVGVAAGVFLLPLILLIVRPRWATIFSTSLLGAVKVTGAALLGVALLNAGWGEAATRIWWAPAVLAGVLLGFGLVVQGRAARRAKAPANAPAAPPPPQKPQSQSGQ